MKGCEMWSLGHDMAGAQSLGQDMAAARSLGHDMAGAPSLGQEMDRAGRKLNVACLPA